MADENKIYYPEIIETFAFPDVAVEEEAGSTNYEGKTNLSPSTKVDQQFPPRRIARETISESINTKTKQILGTFTFGQVGAIAIGVYENGVSGDIRITPSGLVARNINGVETIAIDGSDGSAVFRGTIQAGAVVAGNVTVSGQGSFVVNDGTYDVILLGYLSGGF